MKLSIVVPVLNEATLIVEALSPLQPLRACGHELFVVDGGSHDGTPRLAAPLADRILQSPRGRARQLNEGARQASGDVMVFLHADTRLPEGADRMILDGLARSGRAWGRFDVVIEGRHPLLRVIAAAMNLRSRLTAVCTGDQAIFVQRAQFEGVGGFPPIDLMEDVALSKLLRRQSRPLCLRARAITSGRRWEQRGVWRTMALMWWLRLRYFLGASPERLRRAYESERS